MQLLTDDEELSITVDLGDEPSELVLKDGEDLGNKILDLGVEELIRCHLYQTAPSGAKWDHLAQATVLRKGHDRIGYQTGSMLDPETIRSGPRDVTARYATWTFPQPNGRRRKEHGFHNGNTRNRQPARPLVGWTSRASEQARAIVADARFRLEPKE